jgi:hypothetical protein
MSDDKRNIEIEPSAPLYPSASVADHENANCKLTF